MKATHQITRVFAEEDNYVELRNGEFIIACHFKDVKLIVQPSRVEFIDKKT